MIPLSVPVLEGNSGPYIKECLDTGWVSSAGKYVERFGPRSRSSPERDTPSPVSAARRRFTWHCASRASSRTTK
jgi:hypothetical protein